MILNTALLLLLLLLFALPLSASPVAGGAGPDDTVSGDAVSGDTVPGALPGQRPALHYRASYKGVFSLFGTMDIADVYYSVGMLPVDEFPGTSHPAAQVNQNRRVTGNLPARQVRLEVTSANFATVERLYPFRYLFKSFYQPGGPATLFFEHLKSSKKGRKKKHRVGVIDHTQAKVQLYEASAFEELITPGNYRQLLALDGAGLASKLALKPRGKPIEAPAQMPIDRMTMLALMSEQVRLGIEVKHYRVTNGNELFNYRVTLQDKQDYLLRHPDRPVKPEKSPKEKQQEEKTPAVKAQKLKIESFAINPQPRVDWSEYDDGLVSQARAQPAGAQNSTHSTPGQGQYEYAHAPVYAWFSLAETPLALKFVHHHAVGDFVIELVPRNNR